ncbi:MAG: hypothetical protein NWR72_06265 [Bacteroidia bacterium]|nr:hypothetical protein [Bacteroidia bacterium]
MNILSTCLMALMMVATCSGVHALSLAPPDSPGLMLRVGEKTWRYLDGDYVSIRYVNPVTGKKTVKEGYLEEVGKSAIRVDATWVNVSEITNISRPDKKGRNMTRQRIKRKAAWEAIALWTTILAATAVGLLSIGISVLGILVLITATLAGLSAISATPAVGAADEEISLLEKMILATGAGLALLLSGTIGMILIRKRVRLTRRKTLVMKP